jgi:hypothetical protein
MEKIKERIFPLIIALSALSVSASAAFYSVSGLSKLFAGASLEVIIMTSSLEVAKLVIASLLYQYWDKLNNTLKVYLTIACAILILITSMGIYGFLSSAYQETANKDGAVTQQVTALETKKGLYEQNRDNILKEKQSLAELKGILSKGSTTQYTDKKGNLVVRSNNATIRNIESANKSDEKLSSKLDVVNDSIFSLENKILEIKTNGDAASELGPLKYLSELTGVEMNRIINWLLLVIIFVFDPLAIALVIAANFAFSQLRLKKTYPLEEQVDDMRKVVDTYDTLKDEIENNEGIDIYTAEELEELKDWDVTLMDGLEDLEWNEYNNPKSITNQEPNQTGVPVMLDPKTGKFYYEELEENIYGEDKNYPFDRIDIDPILNQHTESIENMRKIVESYDSLQNITDSTQYNYAKDSLINDIDKHNKDDDTITYF